MKKAFTLIELMVVVLILGILATLAVGVFTTQVERARYAKARTTIATLELAANRYQIDIGVFPPSGSGVPSGPPTFEGCGLLHLALVHSMSGNANAPDNPRWQGPYVSIQDLDLGDINGNSLADAGIVSPVPAGEIQILDPWRSPYRYVRCCGSSTDNYTVNDATVLPTSSPFAATETFYNVGTIQISSKGRDGLTLPVPNIGTDDDDVNNFGQ
jgi:prepilin-type N-terminal cleavage/methylation domain-containing protein